MEGKKKNKWNRKRRRCGRKEEDVEGRKKHVEGKKKKCRREKEEDVEGAKKKMWEGRSSARVIQST